MNPAAALLDRAREAFGHRSGAAFRIVAAVEVIAENRDHVGDRRRGGVVGDVAAERRDPFPGSGVRDMARDEVVPRASHPRHCQRMGPGKAEQCVGIGWHAGNAAARGARRIHRREHGENILEQRGNAGRLCRILLADHLRIEAPVARHVDGLAVQHVAMIETLPGNIIGDAETLEHGAHRAARLPAGDVVHTGVEPEHQFVVAGRIAFPSNAQPVMREAAGHDMLLADDNLQPGISQQRGGGQAADAGADDGHVASLVVLRRSKRRAGKIRRRPVVALVAFGHRRQGAPHQYLWQQDRRHAARRHRQPVRQRRHADKIGQRHPAEQHGPHRRDRHVDGLEQRRGRRALIFTSGKFGGPGPPDHHAGGRADAERQQQQRGRIPHQCGQTERLPQRHHREPDNRRDFEHRR